MEASRDTYKTIKSPSSEVLFKDRGSKFFGFAFPIKDEEDAKSNLEIVKKTHHSARHWCYAYQLGETYDNYRVNDDGEPSNSAGMPIYGQIQSFDLTNILVIVVRYFGGTKLGVGGLIQAYKAAAQMAIEDCRIVQKTINTSFILLFEYPEMNTVMRILKEEKINIVKQDLAINCKLEIAIRLSDVKRIEKKFNDTYKVKIKQGTL